MAISRSVFAEWVSEALHNLGGKGNIREICRQVWQDHGGEIQADDEAFYVWQYEIRWGGQILRDKGVLKPKDECPRGTWELAVSATIE